MNNAGLTKQALMHHVEVVGEQTLTSSSSGSRRSHPVSSVAHGVGIKNFHASEIQPFRDLPARELVSDAICFSGCS